MPMAARVGDQSTHGGVITGPGVATVLVGGAPAAVVGDLHTCPLVSGTVPHVGGPVLPPGVPTVLVQGRPAAVQGGAMTCTGPPDSIAVGCPTVLIGG